MWFYSLIITTVFAQTERISSVNHNLSSVDKVYIAAGLASVVEFPKNIIEVRVGDNQSVKALISQVSPKELTIYLSSTASKASNLIVRADKKVYVFDIVPSTTNHQDYVKIKGSFGSPNYNGAYTKLQSGKIEPQSKSEPRFHVNSKKVVRVSP